MTYQEIKSFINTYIVQNGVNAITGAQLNTALNALADYYGFDSVVVTTLPAGSDATANVQGKTLELGIPKGADGVDGRDGSDAVNPFKGWFNSLDDLKDSYTASVGDSAYVKDASPATTWSIYVYDSTASSDNYWADSGTDADTSNVQTFASGEEVYDVNIVNDLTTGGSTNVASAETVKILNIKDFEKGSSLYDAAYILRKKTNDSTTDDNADGTFIRVIFHIADEVKVNVSIESKYLTVCTVYNTLQNALIASNIDANVIQSLTGTGGVNKQWAKVIGGTINQGGWLCISMKKDDMSMITNAEKSDMIDNLNLKLYTVGTCAEILDEQGKGANSRIDGMLDTEYPTLHSVEMTGQVVTISAKQHAILESLTVNSNVKVIGKNLLSAASFQPKKIINDSGNEVSDSISSYYSFKIPCHGKTLKSSQKMQRVCLWDASGNFISRTAVLNAYTYEVTNNSAYFATIQIGTYIAEANACVIYADDPEEITTDYEVFFCQDNIPDYGTIRLYKEDASNITATLSLHCKYVIPEVKAVSEYGFWEPDFNVTNNYKCTPLGQDSQSIPALNTLGYRVFLSDYFDRYVGKYADGYEVKKTELGMDASAAIQHKANPIFSYEFIPPHYNKTVLLSGGMNSCEASTYFGLSYFCKALMMGTKDEGTKEEGMQALYDTTRFIIIPIICPYGISQDPLLYRNANDVRINKNFSYLYPLYGDTWEYNNGLGGQYAGDYPDSEPETKILKAWLNKYNGATFYMDCHSDTGGQASQALSLVACYCADNSVAIKAKTSDSMIVDYYRSKGYFGENDTPTLAFNQAGRAYPKHLYALNVLGIPSLQYEQYPRSTAYGSDGATNNDSYGIKNYVAMIRWLCLIFCQSAAEIIM